MSQRLNVCPRVVANLQRASSLPVVRISSKKFTTTSKTSSSRFMLNNWGTKIACSRPRVWKASSLCVCYLALEFTTPWVATSHSHNSLRNADPRGDTTSTSRLAGLVCKKAVLTSIQIKRRTLQLNKTSVMRMPTGGHIQNSKNKLSLSLSSLLWGAILAFNLRNSSSFDFNL